MKKVYVIGISGASASGKSTIAEAIKEKLPDYSVRLIHMDEYYKALQARPVMMGVTDGKEYRDDNHPAALDLDRCCRDVVEALGGEWDVVIVEGIFTLWEPRLSALLDLKVYVDCDSDERMARRIRRHLAYGQELEEITERYVQAVQPRQQEYVEPSKWKADIILNGFCMPAAGIDMIAGWLRTRLAE